MPSEHLDVIQFHPALREFLLLARQVSDLQQNVLNSPPPLDCDHKKLEGDALHEPGIFRVAL